MFHASPEKLSTFDKFIFATCCAALWHQFISWLCFNRPIFFVVHQHLLLDVSFDFLGCTQPSWGCRHYLSLFLSQLFGIPLMKYGSLFMYMRIFKSGMRLCGCGAGSCQWLSEVISAFYMDLDRNMMSRSDLQRLVLRTMVRRKESAAVNFHDGWSLGI